MGKKKGFTEKDKARIMKTEAKKSDGEVKKDTFAAKVQKIVDKEKLKK